MKDPDPFAALKQQGFGILPDIFSAEFVDRTLGEISRCAPRPGRAGVRHALGVEPVIELARGPQLRAVVSRALGPASFPFRATLFEKTLASNWLVVWHQDTALPLGERREIPGWGPWSVKQGIPYAHAPASVLEQVLALRIHFDQSTPDNGPLRVLPGTHDRGILSDDAIHGLSTSVSAVECVVPKGGVVAMHPLVVHSSSKSRNSTPRRVLHIEYAASESIVSPLRLAIV
jgi:ectoine hydroxylase-related dioxygenase (phytanoyl-CoA dioxygenase family)